jgi:hypothetical protein
MTSLHVSHEEVPYSKGQTLMSAIENSKALRDFFNCYGPVGCRDYSSLSLLTKAGIDAYFSGCLTLTFEGMDVVRSDYILAIDIDGDDCDYLQMKTGRRVIRVSNESQKNYLTMASFKIEIDNYLELIEKAWVVITGRLHGALPAVALKTPVIFVSDNLKDPRFGGLIEHIALTCTRKDMRWIPASAFNEPIPNPGTHIKIASQLKNSILDFASEHGRSRIYNGPSDSSLLSLQIAAGERDALLAERDALLAERDALLAEIQRTRD